MVCVERGYEIASSDITGMVELNRRFHRSIWLASHNESLIDLLERLDLHLGRYPGTTLASDGRWESALEEHRVLVEAIERRDAVAAHEIGLRHFLSARDI